MLYLVFITYSMFFLLKNNTFFIREKYHSLFFFKESFFLGKAKLIHLIKE